MTIGINTSPLAGKRAKADGEPGQGPARRRARRQRLAPRLADRAARTRGRCRAAASCSSRCSSRLMRREGFELTVGKPQVVIARIDGKAARADGAAGDRRARGVRRRRHPAARPAQGRLEQMVNHGTGWVRMEYLVPARGLIGFRTEFLTETRGTGILHHVFEALGAVARRAAHAPTGSLVADRRGAATAFAIVNLQERGSLFVAPGDERLRGDDRRRERARHDLDVNATKEKKLTNMRAVDRRRARAADPAATALARAGARVHPRRRVRRGDAEERPAAQGRARPRRARVPLRAGSARQPSWFLRPSWTGRSSSPAG